MSYFYTFTFFVNIVSTQLFKTVLRTIKELDPYMF